MKKVLNIFLKGAFVLAPIAITLYILYKVYILMDGLFRPILESVGLYFTGFGAILTLGLIFLVGLLASNWATNHFLKFIDKLFTKVPFIKSIYNIIKDTINSFSGNKKGFSQLVIVDLPNSPVKFLGFLTNDEPSKFVPEGYVAVYLMQSLQWAGNLILVPKDAVKPVEASSEEALKFIASAGLIS